MEEMKQRLLERYQMRTSISCERMRRLGRIPMQYSPSSDGYMDYTYDIEEVQCCNITMPLDKLEELLEAVLQADEERYLRHSALTICKNSEKEATIRNKDPRLKSAWNKYQTLLNLVRHDYD